MATPVFAAALTVLGFPARGPRERERKREKERWEETEIFQPLASCLVTRAEISRSEETGTKCRDSTWVAGTKVLESTPAFPRGHISKKLVQKQRNQHSD